MLYFQYIYYIGSVANFIFFYYLLKVVFNMIYIVCNYSIYNIIIVCTCIMFIYYYIIFT